MPRSVSRLVAVVCLAGFVLANGGFALACAAFKSGAKGRHVANKPATKSTCKHCLAKAQRATQTDCDEVADAPKHSPDQDECPCCPKNEKGCPFPGGCTFCSVAKATCVPVLAVEVDAVRFSGERIPTASDRSFSGFVTSLDRPPRV